MIKLLHAWRSSASRRVRLCLAEKRLAYESQIVDVLGGQHHSPEYLAINPNGVIPALLHDDKVLYESSTICEYIDEVFPEPPVRPADPYQRALMRNFVRYTDEKCLPNMIVLNWSVMMQPVSSRWTNEELAQRLAKIPSMERREAWMRIARRPYTEEEKTEAMNVLVGMLDKAEAKLGDDVWLAGPTYSIADMAAVPFAIRVEELNPDAMSAARRPRVAAWWGKVKSRPAYREARLLPFLAPDGAEEFYQ